MTISKVKMLAPESCGSTVIVYVKPPKFEKGGKKDHKRIDATAYIKMSDCSRWVEWNMFETYTNGERGYQIKKLNRAIQMLTEARDKMVSYQSKYREMDAIAKAHNKALNKGNKKGNKLEIDL